MPTVAVDIDGVVADPRHRVYFLEDGLDWDGFYSRVSSDFPISRGIALVQDLASRFRIAWTTARDDSCSGATIQWLEKHVHIQQNNVPLYMRPRGDRRTSSELKVEMFQSIGDLAFIVDDDLRVVLAASRAGIPAMTFFALEPDSRLPAFDKDLLALVHRVCRPSWYITG